MNAMSRSRNCLRESVSDNGWGMFASFLTHTLEEQGEKLVRVGGIFCKQPDLFCLWLQNCKHAESCVKRVGLSDSAKDPVMTEMLNAAVPIRNEGMRLVMHYR